LSERRRSQKVFTDLVSYAKTLGRWSAAPAADGCVCESRPPRGAMRQPVTASLRMAKSASWSFLSLRRV
jgi:hypothetical protein